MSDNFGQNTTSTLLATNSSESYLTISGSKPGATEPAVCINLRTGEVKVGKDYHLDEASLAFWHAVHRVTGGQ